MPQYHVDPTADLLLLFVVESDHSPDDLMKAARERGVVQETDQQKQIVFMSHQDHADPRVIPFRQFRAAYQQDGRQYVRVLRIDWFAVEHNLFLSIMLTAFGPTHSFSLRKHTLATSA